MKYLKTIGISLGVSLVVFIGLAFFVYKYIPLFPTQLLNENSEAMLGATITEISGTDTMSNFPTIYNANLNSLNDNKIEISTTTLPLLTGIGIITTGTWNADELTVAYGGTGSTTPTLNQIMIGNGSSGFKVIGFGTAGQFLTSGGADIVPSWTTSSINEAGNYAWTGVHTGIGIVGEIIAYASSTAPTGWLLCDGSEVSSTTYANLFVLVGYTYGGSAGGDFNLPNLSGRQITMASSSPNIGQTGGETDHTQTLAELVAHSHTYNDGTTAATGGLTGGATHGNVTTPQTSTTGSGDAFNVLDPYLVLNYIIKY